jgi:hypothetical protein
MGYRRPSRFEIMKLKSTKRKQLKVGVSQAQSNLNAFPKWLKRNLKTHLWPKTNSQRMNIEPSISWLAAASAAAARIFQTSHRHHRNSPEIQAKNDFFFEQGKSDDRARLNFCTALLLLSYLSGCSIIV